MTKYIKFSTLALAVCAMSVPEQLAAASSQANVNLSLVGSSDPSKPLTYNYTGPAPTWLGGVFFQFSKNEPTSGPLDFKNRSSIRDVASYSNSVIKADYRSYVRMGTGAKEFQDTVSSYGSFSISTRDNISFLGIEDGDTATLYLGNYADISTKYYTKMIANGDNPIAETSTSTQFSFSNKALIFDSFNDYFSETARPKYSHEFHSSDGTRVCEREDLLRDGSKQSVKLFEVDNNDVLVLTSDLYLSNFLSATKPAGSYAWVDAFYNTDFSNSGYTFLKMLTPGTSYVSEAGETYLTELPPGVPEPQSWAMLIVGFGVVGGAMRNRRQAAQPRRVAA